MIGNPYKKAPLIDCGALPYGKHDKGESQVAAEKKFTLELNPESGL